MRRQKEHVNGSTRTSHTLLGYKKITRLPYGFVDLLELEKTILSTHIVHGLIEHTKIASLKTLFAFFFCDFSQRYTATDVLRSWIVQLVQQEPKLASHLRTDFEVHGDRLRTLFETLCRILLSMMHDSLAQQTVLFLDALDECDQLTQKQICDFMKHDLGSSTTLAAKIIMVSRPQKLIGDSLADAVSSIVINSTTISQDLRQYIHREVSSFQKSHSLGEASCNAIRQRLLEYNGGTFLWVSLALQRMRSAKIAARMISLLMEFPTALNDVYDRMLMDIPEDDCKDAHFIFRILVASSNWLDYNDLSMLYCIRDMDRTRFPTPDQVYEARGCHEYCGAFISLRGGFGEISRESLSSGPHSSSKYSTVSPERATFIHASVEDYLTSSHLKDHPHLSHFYCDPLSCHLEMSEQCLTYRHLAMQDLDVNAQWQALCNGIIESLKTTKVHFSLNAPVGAQFLMIPMFLYCYPTSFSRNMFDHLEHLSQGASSKVFTQAFRIIHFYKDQALLTGALVIMSEYWTSHMIRLPWIDPNQQVGGSTALMRATIARTDGASSARLLDLLLSHPDLQVNAYDEEGMMSEGTALMNAARRADRQAVASLLRHPMIDVNMRTMDHTAGPYNTALLEACKGLYYDIVKTLLYAGASPYKLSFGRSLIHEVCCIPISPGRGISVKLTIAYLLAVGVDIDAKDDHGQTLLHLAAQ